MDSINILFQGRTFKVKFGLNSIIVMQQLLNMNVEEILDSLIEGLDLELIRIAYFIGLNNQLTLDETGDLIDNMLEEYSIIEVCEILESSLCKALGLTSTKKNDTINIGEPEKKY